MTKRSVAILGLGETGAAWAKALHAAGWSLRIFDPAEIGTEAMPKGSGCRRMQTISSTVRDAAWIVVALPQRLELVQKVIQRVQAEAPRDAIVIATTRALDLDAMQASAPRAERIVQLGRDENGEMALNMTMRNDDGLRASVLALLSEVEADLDLPMAATQTAGGTAKTA